MSMMKLNKILDKKSNSKSVKFRNEGTNFYNDGKFFEALLKYNESLCFAKDDLNLALAYANRSAVYFELKLYQQCLNNIQLAREHKYPAEKMKILEDREKRCLEVMMQETKISDDPFDYFKLSYKANPKIPFLIERVEMKVNKKYGRGIYAKQPLKVGDIISIEGPFVNLLISDATYKNCHIYKASNKFNYCHHCLNDNLLDLIPCPNCRSTMYCNEKCKKSAYRCHSYECKIAGQLQENGELHMLLRPFFQALSIVDGSFEELEKISQECQQAPKTIFDFDFSDPNDPEYQKNRLRSSLSLAKEEKAENFLFFEAVETAFNLSPDLSHLWSSHQKIIRKVIQHIYEVQQLPMCPIERYPVNDQSPVKVGQGNFLFGALFNHSCTPNAIQDILNDKMVMRIIKPVAKGEQLSDTYTDLFFYVPKIQRQKSLLFKCDCEACKNPYRFSLFDQLEIFDHKLYNFALSLAKLDYDSMQREEVVAKSNYLKETAQRLYLEGKFPSKEYVLLQYCFFKCYYCMVRRHKLFLK